MLAPPTVIPPHAKRFLETGHFLQLRTGNFFRQKRTVVLPRQILHHQIGELRVKPDKLGDDGVAGTAIERPDLWTTGNTLKNCRMVAQNRFQRPCRTAGQHAHPLKGNLPRGLPPFFEMNGQQSERGQRYRHHQQHELCTDRQTVKAPHQHTFVRKPCRSARRSHCAWCFRVKTPRRSPTRTNGRVNAPGAPLRWTGTRRPPGPACQLR